MELAEFEADAERVMDQVVEGRVDTPWLRTEIERLTALRDTLPEQDREAANWTLDELRDYLDIDEAEESQSPDDASIAQQAKQIRIDVQNSADLEELERALAQLEQL